jgi:sortase A
MKAPFLTIASAASFITGIVLLGIYASARVNAASEHEAGIEAFAAARDAVVLAQASVESGQSALDANTAISSGGVSPAAPVDMDRLSAPDMSDWSENRIRAYEALAARANDLPEGIMRIPTVDLELPVFAGTEEKNLTRGAGRIEGTPPLGASGNTGIAAHRDGYFRALKDVKLGDAILVDTLAGTHEYEIVDLFIVDPADVHVLDPTEDDAITLVTCYPFYFVGHAPQRYIVRAHRKSTGS